MAKLLKIDKERIRKFRRGRDVNQAVVYSEVSRSYCLKSQTATEKVSKGFWKGCFSNQVYVILQLFTVQKIALD